MPQIREVNLGESWTCECGLTHRFTMWAAAHWKEAFTHTCPCGREHEFLEGTITLINNHKDDTK